MKTRFSEGVSLTAMEMEMQQIPGFRPERSGMTVSRLETGRKQMKQTEQSAVTAKMGILELLEVFSGAVEFPPFTARVSRLTGREVSSFYTAMHRQRFERLWSEQEAAETNSRADNNAMCAALYLLTADPFLWSRAVIRIWPGKIDFSAVRIHGVDLDGYVIFHTARDLYEGRRHVRLSELIDPELVSDAAFRLIVISFLLRRYGVDVLYVKT